MPRRWRPRLRFRKACNRDKTAPLVKRSPPEGRQAHFVAANAGDPLLRQTLLGQHEAPGQLVNSRSPSSTGRTTGASLLGKIADFGSMDAMRLPDTRKSLPMAPRVDVIEYRLHIGQSVRSLVHQRTLFRVPLRGPRLVFCRLRSGRTSPRLLTRVPPTRYASNWDCSPDANLLFAAAFRPSISGLTSFPSNSKAPSGCVGPRKSGCGASLWLRSAP